MSAEVSRIMAAPSTAGSQAVQRELLAQRRFMPKLGLYDILMVLFVAAMVAQEPTQKFSMAINGLGIAFAGLSVFYLQRRKGKLPRELVLFALYIGWGLICSFLSFEDPAEMMPRMRLLLKEVVFFFALTEYVIDRKRPTIVFLLLTIVPIVYWIYSRQTGELSLTTLGPAGRLQSFADNPNGVAYACTYGLMGVAYLLWNPKSQRLTIWPLLAIPPIATVLLLSGSRKNILAFAVLFMAWGALAYGAVGKWRIVRRVFMTLMVIGFVFQVARTVLPTLPVAGRFEKIVENPQSNPRVVLYMTAIRLFAESPITGHGLGGFRRAGGLVSHSDYADALAETGFVGFVIYFSIYFILLRRLQRLRTHGRTPTVRYLAGAYQATIVTLLFLGLGFANLYLVWSIYILAIITGHSYVLERSSDLSAAPASVTSG